MTCLLLFGEGGGVGEWFQGPLSAEEEEKGISEDNRGARMLRPSRCRGCLNKQKQWSYYMIHREERKKKDGPTVRTRVARRKRQWATCTGHKA